MYHNRGHLPFSSCTLRRFVSFTLFPISIGLLATSPLNSTNDKEETSRRKGQTSRSLQTVSRLSQNILRGLPCQPGIGDFWASHGLKRFDLAIHSIKTWSSSPGTAAHHSSALCGPWQSTAINQSAPCCWTCSCAWPSCHASTLDAEGLDSQKGK